MTEDDSSADTPPAVPPATGVSQEIPPATALPPEPDCRHRRRWFGIALGVALVLLLAGTWHFWSGWSHRGRLDPHGGVYFVKRVELSVPSFRQGDPKWSEDLLGPTDGTLGAEGCAVASTAMILASYGIDTDPQRLNEFLKEHEGFTPQGWIYWEKAAELAPEKVRHVYEDAASYRLIDTNLWRGNPVIVKLRLPSGVTHFVVIAGKDGYDYLTRDPGSGGAKGLYPLRELRSPIEGLRYYEKLR